MPQEEFRHIVRVVNTDLDGNKPILSALRKIKGVSFMFAQALCYIAKIPTGEKAGTLPEIQIEKIAACLRNPVDSGMPEWMINRRKDPEDGKDKHLVATDLVYARDNDIKMMQKIKCYRGIRHMYHQPVRGQRTKAHFRANKGKVVGVKRAKAGSRKT